MNILRKSKNIFLALSIVIPSTVLSIEYDDSEGRTTFYVPTRAKAPLYVEHHKNKDSDENKKKVTDTKKKCIFCSKIEEVNDEENLLLTRFKHNAVWLNLYPYTKGHILIIPKRHVENLEDMNEEEAIELAKIIGQSPRILKEVLGAEGTNIGQNTGKAAGTTLKHIHVHVVPRYSHTNVNHRIPSFVHTVAAARFIGWDMNEIYSRLKPHFDQLKYHEPQNLAHARSQVQEYYDSGALDQEITRVMDDAWQHLEFVPATDTSVIVIDIDETALSNYVYYKRMGFGKGTEDIFSAWKKQGKGQVIKSTLEFYKKAIAKGFKIFFISCRGVELYDATSQNLKREGYTTFEGIILRTEDDKKIPFYEYKKNARRKLVEKHGYDIVACVGDQWSDLEGDYAGHRVKVPNYILSE